MEWLKEELDKLNEKQDRMAEILAKNTAILDEHVRRTNLLESKLDPIQKHVHLVEHGAKVLVSIIGIFVAFKSLKLF